ncbi:hypothetical protein MtrunA17_Chr8g0359521 [Medicago truncatula]|nr:hypothetical protein MtrunA17_Chr8g0359301 [Medicago truncatula]RHN40850.1 hypothetical protein MtrunA17_Chr8g0359521 [Medicago truncatula]
MCTLSDISIKHYETHDFAHGMPVWRVSITNNCGCPQSQVKLNCTGFQSYIGIDQALLAVSDTECLVKQGAPIPAAQSVFFRYAWLPKFKFEPISSKIGCT